MAATHTAPGKAISVLKITGLKARTRLLDLPRELRDEIWKLVVDDPPLLERKHDSTCQFYDPNADATTPPAIRTYRPLSMISCLWPCRDDRAEPLTQAEEHCLRFCVRRKGFSLFRVNEQLRVEASESWSRQHVDITFLRAGDMTNTISKLSQSARSCIKSLKVYELEQTCDHHETFTLWSGQQLLLKFLPDLVNLQHLEVPPRLMKSGGSWSYDWSTGQEVTTGKVRDCLAQMQTLESVRLTLLLGRSLKDICSRTPLQGMFVTISDDHETRQCEAKTLKQLPFRSCSDWSSDKVDAICRSADNMAQRQYPSYCFVQPLPALEQFEEEAPTYSEGVPCTFQSQLQGRDYRVAIWGLPEASPEARRRRMAEQRMAEAERHRRLHETFKKVQEEESEDDTEDIVPSKASHRMRTSRVAPRKDERVQRIEAENRTRRNANREKREHVQESEKARKEREVSREVQKLAMEAKRATRKRTPRNQRDIRER